MAERQNGGTAEWAKEAEEAKGIEQGAQSYAKILLPIWATYRQQQKLTNLYPAPSGQNFCRFGTAYASIWIYHARQLSSPKKATTTKGRRG